MKSTKMIKWNVIVQVLFTAFLCFFLLFTFSWSLCGKDQPGESQQQEPETLDGISTQSIIDWLKNNPWIIDMIKIPDNKLKEELKQYWNLAAAWQTEKQQKIQQLLKNKAEIISRENAVEVKKVQASGFEREINNTTIKKAEDLKNADKETLLNEHTKKDILIETLKILQNVQNSIIQELDTALYISETISQSNQLFYSKELQLRSTANGILNAAAEITGSGTNLFTFGLGGYYDPFNNTYGAGIFVGVNIKTILRIIR